MAQAWSALVAVRTILICTCLVLFVLSIGPVGWCCGKDSTAARWLVRRLCRALLRLLGVRVICEDGCCAPQTARLVVANHVSWLDVLVLESTEALCFLAKREVAHWPVVAFIARLLGTVFVDRARRRDILRVNVAMAARLRAGRSVLLFPEGTTYGGTRRGKFFTSHLACLRTRFEQEPDLAFCSVQAIGLTYSDPAAAWIGDMSLVPHVFRVLGKPGIRCALVYGPLLRVERVYDRKALGRILGDEVERLVARPAGWRCRIGLDRQHLDDQQHDDPQV